MVAEELGEELQGVFADEGVVVEEEEEFGVGGAGGLVVAAGETLVLGVAEEGGVGKVSRGVEGGVCGGVVDYDCFYGEVTAGFFDGGEEVAEHVSAVPVDDEDGEVWGPGHGRRHFIALGGEMWYENVG